MGGCILSRLVCVSNRVALPREAARAGGLAVALREALKECGGLWFGWSGDVADKEAEGPRIRQSGGITYATIDLTRQEHQDFYVDFSNGVLWPLFHHQLDRSDFHRSGYDGYRQVNRSFARHLAPLLNDDDLIWIHDYHFIPLAAELRRLGVRNRIGFFLHIPFPAAELLTALPVHRQIVGDLCKYDVVGFQTEDDVRALIRYVIDEDAGTVGSGGYIDTLGRSTRVAAFPIGIDADRFSRIAQKADGSDETRRLLDSLAGRINGRFSEFDWTPVRYLNKALSRDILAGFFRASRVGFITPVRDGMNLVAKEYVAAQDPEDPGVLVLSRFAGAARELTEALIVNPYDVDEMATALHRALSMPLAERIARWTAMNEVVTSNTITVWHESFVRELSKVRTGSQLREPPPHLLAAPAAQV